MNLRSAAVTLCALLLAAAAVLWFFDRQISRTWFRLGVRPEIVIAFGRTGGGGPSPLLHAPIVAAAGACQRPAALRDKDCPIGVLV